MISKLKELELKKQLYKASMMIEGGIGLEKEQYLKLIKEKEIANIDILKTSFNQLKMSGSN